MYPGYPYLILILALCTTVLFILLPLKLAAGAMGAKRTGFLWCFVALFCASFVEGIGLTVPVFGGVIAFLLSAAVFAGILQTDYLRGIAIAILHIFFSIVILLLAALIAGIGFSQFLPYWM